LVERHRHSGACRSIHFDIGRYAFNIWRMHSPMTTTAPLPATQQRDVVELLLLGALWGASFLFMRVAAPEFGPVPLIAVRVGVAALLMWPLMFWPADVGRMERHHLWPLAVVGLLNSALPFCLFAFAALKLPSGFSAVLNATAALWGALMGGVLFGERVTVRAACGLALGFLGVTVMTGAQMQLPGEPGEPGATALAGAQLAPMMWAVGAALAATACYGFCANYTRHRLQGVGPLRVAAASQLAAAAALLPLGLWAWPATAPSSRAWGAALALAVLCTALAYALYFRLIARLGAARAMTVTLLVPVFGVAFGAVALHETLTPWGATGAVLVLGGTALAVYVRSPAAKP
jgi:drug/metabolite transporter (DMT)-like permease